MDKPPAKHRVIVILVLGHLLLVATSLLSTVSPSGLVSQILAIGNPYLRATHAGVDARPVYLAHGKPDEQPLRLQIDEDRLMPPTITGAGSDDRQQRWLATVALLAEREQPSLLAELVLPILKRPKASESAKSFNGSKLSLIREPTILSDVLEDQAPPIYEARIIESEGTIAVVRLLPSRLTAIAIQGEAIAIQSEIEGESP